MTKLSIVTEEQLKDLEAQLLQCENEDQAMNLLVEAAGGNPFEVVRLAVLLRHDLKQELKHALEMADKHRNSAQHVPIEMPPDGFETPLDDTSNPNSEGA